MSDYDRYLELKRADKFDAPNYYKDCVGCEYSHHPENLVTIGELPTDLCDYLIEQYGDEPEQEICSDCLFVAKVELSERSPENFQSKSQMKRVLIQKGHSMDEVMERVSQFKKK